MTEPTPPEQSPIAIIRGWRDLAAAFRAAIDHRKTTCECVDEVAGFSPRYCAKLTAPVPERELGEMSFDALSGTLGVMLLMVDIDDAKKLAKIKGRLEGRVEWRVRNARLHSGAVEVRVSKRFLKKIGKKGGHNSRKYMSKREARALSKKANRARWPKPDPSICDPTQAAHAPDTSPVV